MNASNFQARTAPASAWGPRVGRSPARARESPREIPGLDRQDRREGGRLIRLASHPLRSRKPHSEGFRPPGAARPLTLDSSGGVPAAQLRTFRRIVSLIRRPGAALSPAMARLDIGAPWQAEGVKIRSSKKGGSSPKVNDLPGRQAGGPDPRAGHHTKEVAVAQSDTSSVTSASPRSRFRRSIGRIGDGIV